MPHGEREEVDRGCQEAESTEKIWLVHGAISFLGICGDAA
jgi:hypothetical protein